METPGCRPASPSGDSGRRSEGKKNPVRSTGEASLTPGNTVGVDDRGACGLFAVLSAPLVRPWQVDWQGLHPEVGGLRRVCV